mmetsp:Transcript_89388/g.233015  ORF Transcript_89388/g.233015 Transcript_89388/m.233015 type:complete len:435 (-) Transcript_89388:76-1380(-)
MSTLEEVPSQTEEHRGKDKDGNELPQEQGGVDATRVGEFSVTATLASGKRVSINGLMPENTLEDLYCSAARKVFASVARITLGIGGRIFKMDAESELSLTSLGIAEGANLFCVKSSRWQSVQEGLLQCDLADIEDQMGAMGVALHWRSGGIDEETGLLLLCGYQHLVGLVIPPEACDQPPYFLKVPEDWTCNKEHVPAWARGFLKSSRLTVSGGYCTYITESELVHFKLEEGLANATVIDCCASALGVDGGENRVVYAAERGEIRSRLLTHIADEKTLFLSRDDKRVESLACVGKSIMILASSGSLSSSSVHIYIERESGWSCNVSLDIGLMDTLISMSRRGCSHTVGLELLRCPGNDYTFLLSGNEVHRLWSNGEVTLEGKVNHDDFLLEDDNGSPNPLLGGLLGVYNHRMYRIVEQSYFDSWPVRCLCFGSP